MYCMKSTGFKNPTVYCPSILFLSCQCNLFFGDPVDTICNTLTMAGKQIMLKVKILCFISKLKFFYKVKFLCFLYKLSKGGLVARIFSPVDKCQKKPIRCQKRPAKCQRVLVARIFSPVDKCKRIFQGIRIF